MTNWAAGSPDACISGTAQRSIKCMTQVVGIGELVDAATRGEQRAWDAIVDRYLPLVISVVRRYRLADKDAEDVSQTVWLRLVERIDTIREPRALPGWISTTTKNEALRVLRKKRGTDPVEPGAGGPLDITIDFSELDDGLIQAERQRAVLDGLAELSEQHRRLLLLCAADPPVSYHEISRLTGMPMGSIGPTRSRCLAKLRDTAPIRTLVDEDRSNGQGSGRA